MTLKSANENITKYGFPVTIEYSNDLFHGTQKGICICIKDNETGNIVRNSMPKPVLEEGDTSDIEVIKLNELNKLLEDKEILLIEEGITQQEEDGQLKARTIYYLPYYVADHSFLKPTVLYDNISGAINVSNKVSVEILFVEDNLNRYITLNFDTKNVSVMDLVYELFDETFDSNNELAIAGVHYEKETDDSDEGYYLDFYDEAGNSYDLCFSTLERLRDSIVSMRLINIESEIEEGII